MTEARAMHQLLRELFDTAVSAVSAQAIIPGSIPPLPRGRRQIIAIGKAADALAVAAAQTGMERTRGLVVSPVPEKLDLPPGFDRIEPGVEAAKTALVLADSLTAEDQLLVLVSGGGSVSLMLPAEGVDAAEKQKLVASLSSSGATISEINAVRKGLSQIKGGRLALSAAPAEVVTLAISNVTGDDIDQIASGPTVASRTTLGHARAVVSKYGVEFPKSVLAALTDLANEPPRHVSGGYAKIVARAQDALAAAETMAKEKGYNSVVLSDAIEGEAQTVGRRHGELVLRTRRKGVPMVLLSGGETTVAKVSPDGRGGRNLEYLLGLAIALDGASGVYAIAADTDGFEGTSDAAGAVISADTLTRARNAGLDPQRALQENRSHEFFEALGDLVKTGHSFTSVSDFRAILIEG